MKIRLDFFYGGVDRKGHWKPRRGTPLILYHKSSCHTTISHEWFHEIIFSRSDGRDWFQLSTLSYCSDKSWVIVTDTLWPAKPKICIIFPITENSLLDLGLSPLEAEGRETPYRAKGRVEKHKEWTWRNQGSCSAHRAAVTSIINLENYQETLGPKPEDPQSPGK